MVYIVASRDCLCAGGTKFEKNKASLWNRKRADWAGRWSDLNGLSSHDAHSLLLRFVCSCQLVVESDGAKLRRDWMIENESRQVSCPIFASTVRFYVFCFFLLLLLHRVYFGVFTQPSTVRRDLSIVLMTTT